MASHNPRAVKVHRTISAPGATIMDRAAANVVNAAVTPDAASAMIAEAAMNTAVAAGCIRAAAVAVAVAVVVAARVANASGR